MTRSRPTRRPRSTRRTPTCAHRSRRPARRSRRSRRRERVAGSWSGGAEEDAMSVRGEPVEILLVEDNPGDVRLTKEALREGKVYNNLHWAKDGVEALEFLRREGKFATAP